MARIAYLAIAVIVIIMAVSFQDVSAIKCWRCMSGNPMSDFCDQPFNEASITEEQKPWAYVECPDAPDSNTRSVCRKALQIKRGKQIINRSCYFENINAGKNDCVHVATPSYIKMISCESCKTDGCNGADKPGVFELNPTQ